MTQRKVKPKPKDGIELVRQYPVVGGTWRPTVDKYDWFEAIKAWNRRGSEK